MIIVKLQGGIGNQMFQYAIGRNLALKHNTKLYLDTSLFKEDQSDITPRKYELDVFNIEENYANDIDLKKFKINKIDKLIKIIVSSYRNNYIIEPYFHFKKEILNSPDNIYLDGYWQSEKYFEDIKNIIRQNFTLKKELDYKFNILNYKINNTNSFSLHVRRGDYVSDKKTSEFHGCCSLDYYHRAIDLIVKKINNPYFYIFSDDIEWVKKNLQINHPVKFIEGNHGFEDMTLMSACKHNIIANSSFSWWGAWLNKNPDKIVVAPKKWFNDKKINTKDLIPEKWITI